MKARVISMLLVIVALHRPVFLAAIFSMTASSMIVLLINQFMFSSPHPPQLLASTPPSQFSNIVLTGCVERIVHGARFADQPIGVSLIRGDNIVLLAELVCL